MATHWVRKFDGTVTALIFMDRTQRRATATIQTWRRIGTSTATQ